MFKTPLPTTTTNTMPLMRIANTSPPRTTFGSVSAAADLSSSSIIAGLYYSPSINMDITSALRDQLIAAAHEATKHSHAPYSNFFVGAALLTADGRMFSGCNVENASYGLT